MSSSRSTVGRELPETIRFAMKATRELSPSDWRSQERSIRNLGVDMGHEVAKSLLAKKDRDMYAALISFWTRSGLGTMEIVRSEPPVINLRNCYDCSTTKPKASQNPCTFKGSLLETILCDSLGRVTRIQEVECCKSGGSGCVFQTEFD